MTITLPEGISRGPDGQLRCAWADSADDYRAYHDAEWGMPVTEDQRLFEKICLEGFQSGLSWITILRKREGFRRAFSDFDARRVAGYTDADVEALLQDRGIVRHRGKIASVINNARRAAALAEEHGSLAAYLWRWEPPPASQPAQMTRELLVQRGPCPEAIALSKDLKKRGWSFVGPTTIYAFMQASGMVNDHLTGCACRARVEDARGRMTRPRGRSSAP